MVCQILFGSLVGAVILGAAIALYNMLLGGKRANTRNSEALRSGQPLSLPGVNTAPATIPEPSFAKAMVIVTVLTLASLIGEAIAGHLLSLPIIYLITVGSLKLFLPTSFGKALMVTLLCLVILLVMVAILWGILLPLAYNFRKA